MQKTRPSVVSLFTGAGGMDEGFKASGFDILACMDMEEWACDTIRLNNPNQLVIGPPDFTGDIKDIDAKKFSEITKLKKGDIDVLVGGPPCQPFSQAASQRFLKGDARFKRQGFSDNEKGTLLHEFIAYVKFFSPKVFVLENVAGLLTIDGGVQLTHCLEELAKQGYRITDPRTVNAVNYGVPQYRERLIVWGVLGEDFIPSLPEITHGGDLFTQPYAVVANALINIPNDCPNHVPREHKQQSVDRYRTLDFGQREKLGRVDRLDPLRPSKTVIAGGLTGGGRSHLHPFVARTLTVRECARLQTFPDTFRFTGSNARQFTQVGNAVPPLLAEHFARKILKDVFRKKPPKKLLHEKYLSLGGVEELTQQIFKNALEEKPEWIYLTHSNRAPEKALLP